MASTEEMGMLIRAIRSSMGEATGEFRKAADSSHLMTRAVRDIANIFNAQRRDLADLQNTMADSAYEAEQSSSKLDHLSTLFREMISIQNSTLGELRDIDRGIRVLDQDIYNLSNSLNGGFGGVGTSITNAATGIIEKLGLLGAAGVGAAAGATAASMAMGGGGEGGGGAGGGGGSTGPGGPATGAFKDKAPSIMDRLQKDLNLTKEQSAGVVGSLAAETGGFTKMQEENPRAGRGGYGWAQWTGPRRIEFEKFAKERNLNLNSDEANYQFLLHELKTSQSAELARLRQAKTASDAARIFTGSNREGVGYLRPGAEHYGPSVRYAEKAMNIDSKDTRDTQKEAGNTQTAIPVVTPQSPPMSSTNGPAATQDATPVSPEAPGSRALNSDAMGGHGHGPISGPMGGHGGGEGKLAGVNQGILEKFHQIESQGGGNLTVTSGYRSPAHNAAVGGAKNSAHMRGNAVDVVFGGGVPQALKLIETASKVGIGGIGVYSPNKLHFDTESKRAWGPTYHSDSIPSWAQEAVQKHLSGAVSSGKDQGIQDATAVSAPSPTPGMSGSPMSGGHTGGAELSGAAESSGGGGGMPTGGMGMPAMGGMPMGGNPMASMMMGGGMPMGGNPMAMMGGMPMGGAIGGIVSMVLPALMSSMNQPEQPESAPEMVQTLSNQSINSQTVSQAAVQQQAQQEIAQEAMIQQPDQQPNIIQASSGGVGSSSGGSPDYAYNYPSDTSWPDWAGMIGGMYYKEMNNIKKHMKLG